MEVDSLTSFLITVPVFLVFLEPGLPSKLLIASLIPPNVFLIPPNIFPPVSFNLSPKPNSCLISSLIRFLSSSFFFFSSSLPPTTPKNLSVLTFPPFLSSFFPNNFSLRFFPKSKAFFPSPTAPPIIPPMPERVKPIVPPTKPPTRLDKKLPT